MNLNEHHEQIARLPVIGNLSWTYEGKTHYVEVTEIVYEFPFENEYFIRYKGPLNTCNPLVRVKGNLVYFLTDRASQGEIDWPEFRSKGCKGKLTIF